MNNGYHINDSPDNIVNPLSSANRFDAAPPTSAPSSDHLRDAQDGHARLLDLLSGAKESSAPSSDDASAPSSDASDSSPTDASAPSSDHLSDALDGHARLLDLLSGAKGSSAPSSDDASAPPSPNASIPVSRDRRDAQDELLETIVERMKLVARVANAIYLQKGLIDGSIPAYDVLAELLSFGGVKLEDITGPDAANVGKVLEELRSLGSKLNRDSDTVKVETSYQILYNIKELINEVKNVGDGHFEQKFLDDLTHLGSNGFNWKIPESVYNNVISLKTRIQDLKELSENNKEETSRIVFEKIVSSFTKLSSDLEQLTQSIDSIVQMPSNMSATNSFADVWKLSKALRVYNEGKSKFEFSSKGIDRMAQNVALISDAFKNISPTVLPLESAQAVIQSGAEVDRRRVLLHTAGFSNGLDDLKLLNSLGLDPWLKKITETDKLSKSLTPMDVFSAQVKKISDGISRLNDKEVASIGSVLETTKEYVTTAPIPSNLRSIADDTFKCIHKMPFVKIINPVDLDPLGADVSAVDTEIDKMKGLLRKIVEFFKKDEISKTIAEMKGIAEEATSDDKTLLTNTVSKFLDPLKIGNLEKMIDEFNDIWREVNSKVIKTLANKVSGQNIILDSLQEALNDLKPLFTCLKPLDQDGTLVLNKFIDLSNTTGSLDTVKLKADIGQVTNLFNHLQTIKDVESVPAAMAKLQSPETAALDLLESTVEVSRTLGSATRGISTMKDLIEKKTRFGVVETESKNLKSEIPELLKELVSFNKTLIDLDSWKSHLQKTDSTVLEEYADIFSDAQQVDGIDNFQKVMDIIESVEKKTTDPSKKQRLDTLKQAVNEIMSTGPDLSEFNPHFGNAKNSLHSMDVFFARLKKVDLVAPGSNNTAQVLHVVDFTPADTLPTMNWWFQILELLGGVIGCGIIVGSIIFGLISSTLTAILVFLFVFIDFRRRMIRKRKIARKIRLYSEKTAREKTFAIDVNTAILYQEDVETRGAAMKAEVSLKAKGQVRDSEEEAPANENQPVIVPPKKQEKTEDKSGFSQKVLSAGRSIGRSIGAIVALVAPDEKSVRKGTFYRFIGLWNVEVTRTSQQFGIVNKPLHEQYLRLCQNIVLGVEPIYKAKQPTISDQNRFNPYYLVEFSRVIIQRHLKGYCRAQDEYINANCLTMPNGKNFFLTQTPLMRSAQVRTNDKLFIMAAQTNSKAIVMIESEDELNGKSPVPEDNGENNFKYGMYFPHKKGDVWNLMQMGHEAPLMVKCLEVDVLIPGKLVHRKFKLDFVYPENQQMKDELYEYDTDTSLETRERNIVRTKKKKAEKEREERWQKEHLGEGWKDRGFPKIIDEELDHYQLIGWSNDSPPADTEAVLKVLELIRGRHAIVHCADGIERSGMFAMAEYARQKLHHRPYSLLSSFDFTAPLREVYAARCVYFGVEDPEGQNARMRMARSKQVLFVIKILVHYLKWVEFKGRALSSSSAERLALFERTYNECFGIVQEEDTQRTEEGSTQLSGADPVPNANG